MARSIAASLMQPVAEMPSPSRMIRENESTTRNPSPDRTGDQEAAIVGAEIERGIDAGSRGRRLKPPRTAPAAADPCRPPCGPWPSSPRGPRPSRSRVSSFIQMSFRGRQRPTRNFRSRKL